jgi:hypothetical protein
MAKFPSDQFDTLPDDLTRVGAHRAPASRGRRWVAFGWAALATGVLIAGGLYAVSLAETSFNFTEPSTAAEPIPAPIATAEPITDPTMVIDRGITVTVLNGTESTGLEDDAATVLTDAGWTVGSTAASTATDIIDTIVYYSDAANEDVARGVALELGTADVALSDAFLGAPLTVVVGTDFAAAQ